MNSCDCDKKKYGVIRDMASSKCPHECVIPCVTVQSISGIKGLAACFVQVSDLNTTYYIDDQHRITKIWAGPVEYAGYDYEANPLDLRSQEVWDFQNNRVIRYDKAGNYLVFRGE